jgi:hypothetical protein
LIGCTHIYPTGLIRLICQSIFSRNDFAHFSEIRGVGIRCTGVDSNNIGTSSHAVIKGLLTYAPTKATDGH